MAEGRHGIVNVTHRGILGGYVHHCSCGASIIEPDGGHEATDAHLAGPPDQPRPRKTRHFTDAELAAHDAQVKAKAWDEARKRVQEAHPSCTDECGMCIARDEILDDLSANPYRAAETEATR